jgi:hypothetical protein
LATLFYLLWREFFWLWFLLRYFRSNRPGMLRKHLKSILFIWND